MQVDDLYYQDTFVGVAEPKSNEIQRFELLKNELMELEKRVQDQSDNKEVCFYQKPNNLPSAFTLYDLGYTPILGKTTW